MEISRAYDYLRSKFPAIPYRRIDLSEFPRSSSLGLKIKGRVAYVIVHHGDVIHPSEDCLLVPPGQTIWGTRPTSPITGLKILGDDACNLTSEDVVLAHAVSLFYEEQQAGGYIDKDLAALKADEDMWSRSEKPKAPRSIKSTQSGSQTSEKRSLSSIFKPRFRPKMFTEKESEESDRQERKEVCPWEGV